MDKPTRLSLIDSSSKMLIAEFEKAKSENPHYGERGEEVEQVLIKWLNNHLPKRFAATRGFIMDDKDAISPQTDVIIYDAMNCPVLRYSENSLIIPADNTAVAFEVKSNLTKAEFIDASKKIAAIKSLAKLPISDLDLLPEGAKKSVQTQTLGIIFAFECKVKLKTVALWLRENFFGDIGPNGRHIDFVCILNKGWLDLGIEFPENGVHPIHRPEPIFLPPGAPNSAMLVIGCHDRPDKALLYMLRVINFQLQLFRTKMYSVHTGIFDQEPLEQTIVRVAPLTPPPKKNYSHEDIELIKDIQFNSKGKIEKKKITRKKKTKHKRKK